MLLLISFDWNYEKKNKIKKKILRNIDGILIKNNRK